MEVKGNKKGFYKYISSKRKSRENTGLLLNVAGDVMTKDMEKAETLHALFASIFTGMTDLQESQARETSGKDRSKDNLPSVEKDQVREHLKNWTCSSPQDVMAWICKGETIPVQPHSLPQGDDWLSR